VSDICVETARLRLVPLGARHRDDLCRLFNDPRVADWLFLADPPTPDELDARIAAGEALWRERGYGLFAALDRATDKFVARVGALVTPETGRIEIAWTTRHDAWGKGYATEAARAAIAFTWASSTLDTLDCYLRPDNTASRRVADKVGFRFKDMRWLYDRVLRFYQMPRP
jgi:RimJ/RimL family protein N-acetyltransferase